MGGESYERLLTYSRSGDKVGVDDVLYMSLRFDCFSKMVTFIEFRERLLRFSELIMQQLLKSNKFLNRVAGVYWREKLGAEMREIRLIACSM